MSIPFGVWCILDELEKAGYKAYIVGGAVRDMLMGKIPHDYDITTSAHPEDIKRVFKGKCVTFAEKYGTITVRYGLEECEITTFRKERGYSDSRHPEEVEWADTIEEDLARRDFTINAMALSKDGDIIDPFGGEADIKEGVVRCVGNPKDRFEEDNLRVLRAVRFVSEFPGVGFDPKTVRAIKDFKGKPLMLSAERIRDEFTKMLTSGRLGKILVIMHKLGILGSVFPEVENAMGSSRAEVFAVANAIDEHKISNYTNLCWGMVLSFVENPEKMAERLKFSNKDKEEILFYAKNKWVSFSEDWEIRKFVAEHKKYVPKLLEMQKALGVGTDLWRKKCCEFIKDGSAISLSELKITGGDLMELGYIGKEIAEKRLELYIEVLKFPELNSKDSLLGLAEEEMERD